MSVRAPEILSSVDGRRLGVSASSDWHMRGGMKLFAGKVTEIADGTYTLQDGDNGRALLFTGGCLVNVPATLKRGFNCILGQDSSGTVRIIGDTVNQADGQAYLGGDGAMASLMVMDDDGGVFLAGDLGDGLPDITVRAVQTFSTITSVAGGKVKVTGTGLNAVNDLTQTAIGFNVNTPKSNGGASQTFATITQTARAVGSSGATANQTLATIVQTAAGKAKVTAGHAATLATITQTARDQASGAPTYYISAAGNDANDGLTTATPWLTTTNVQTVLGDAGAMVPGTQIKFRGGDTFNVGAGLYCGGQDGTLAQPIVITSYGTGRATLTGTTSAGFEIISFYSDRGAGFGVTYFTFDNLKFSGPGYATSTGNYNGIFIDCSLGSLNSNITISNCEFTGLLGAITFGAEDNTGHTTDVLVDTCYIHDCRTAGVLSYALQGSGTVASQKLVYNRFVVQNCWVETMGTEGIALGFSSNTEIKYCLARDCGKLAGGCVGIWTYISAFSHIHHCESDHITSTSLVDGDGFDIDLWNSDCIIEHCYAHDNKGADILMYDGGGGGTVWTRNHVRYNICVNGGATTTVYGCILASGNGTAMPNNYIYNNTLIQQTANRSALRTNTNFQGRIGNNLVITTTATTVYLYWTTTTESASLTIVGNAWYASAGRIYRRNSVNYATLTALQAVNTAFEKVGGVNVGFEADPVMAGAGLASMPFGNLFTVAPDINQTLWNSKIAAAGFGIFKLDSTSPYKDAGRNFPSEASITGASVDFFGNAVPAGTTYSIGAHDL